MAGSSRSKLGGGSNRHSSLKKRDTSQSVNYDTRNISSVGGTNDYRDSRVQPGANRYASKSVMEYDQINLNNGEKRSADSVAQFYNDI